MQQDRRQEQDRLFADARKAIGVAVSALREAGLAPWDPRPPDMRDLGKAVREAERRYHQMSEAARPPTLDEDLRWMRAQPGGPAEAHVDRVITWLEEDQFSYNSGFRKQDAMRALRRFALTETQAERVRAMILDCLPRGPRQEFSETRRLARALATPDFLTRVQALESSDDPGTAERARLVAGLCRRVIDQREASGDGSRPSQADERQP